MMLFNNALLKNSWLIQVVLFLYYMIQKVLIEFRA